MEEYYPQNPETERAILGSALLDRRSCVLIVDRVQTEDFFVPHHRIIFTHIQLLVRNAVIPDYVTLTDSLIKANDSAAVGGAEYIASLTTVVPSVRATEYYIDDLKEYAKFRKLISLSHNIVAHVKKGQQKAGDISEWAMACIIQMQSDVRTEVSELRSIIDRYVDYHDDLRKKDKKPGINTGFVELDSVISGIEPGEVIVLAARPSVGKTALASNLALSLHEQGKRVLLISAEMTWKGLAPRFISMASDVNLRDIRTGKAIETPKTNMGVRDITTNEPQILIYEAYCPSDMNVRMATQIATYTYGHLDLVIVDYIQLLQSSVQYRSMNETVQAVSRNIKGMATDPNINCAFLVLSQLNRGSEREDRRPRLSDLRDSGAIEQDADVVAFLHKKPQPTNADVHFIEVDVAKNRQGAISIGEKLLAFHRPTTTFYDATARDKGEYWHAPPRD